MNETVTFCPISEIAILSDTKLPSQLFVYINGYYPAIGSLYHHMICNVPVSCKVNGDKNQLDSDIIFG